MNIFISRIIYIYIEGSNIIEEIIIEGKITDNDGTQISIPYTSLEKITDLKLEWFDKKVKNIKQKEFLETSLTSRNFYDGVKSLQYYIPRPTIFKLKNMTLSIYLQNQYEV